LKGDDPQIDRLLSRGYLGGPRHDAILREVLKGAEVPSRARSLRRWLALALVPGAAVAAGLAVWLTVASPAQPPFTEKGGAGGVPASAVNLACGPAKGRVCRVGDTLMFTVNAAVISGYFGAYAERVDAAPPGVGNQGAAGERIWYFPTAAGAAPVVAPGQGTLVLPDGIRLGPEHRPGRYRVTVWLSSAPLGRSAVDKAPADALRGRSTIDFRVSER